MHFSFFAFIFGGASLFGGWILHARSQKKKRKILHEYKIHAPRSYMPLRYFKFPEHKDTKKER